MKTRIFMLTVAITGFFLFGCGGSGQVNDDQILGNVENPRNYDTFTLLRMDDDISIFADMVEQSGLDVSLLFADNFTVFVPTNEAFGNMDVARFEELTNPQNRAELLEFVKWHFMPNKVLTTQLEENQVIDIADGKYIPVSTDMQNAVVRIGGALVIKPDIQTEDGIMHIINGVITPVDELDAAQ